MRRVLRLLIARFCQSSNLIVYKNTHIALQRSTHELPSSGNRPTLSSITGPRHFSASCEKGPYFFAWLAVAEICTFVYEYLYPNAHIFKLIRLYFCCLATGRQKHGDCLAWSITIGADVGQKAASNINYRTIRVGLQSKRSLVQGHSRDRLASWNAQAPPAIASLKLSGGADSENVFQVPDFAGRATKVQGATKTQAAIQ